eukprot:scaffold82248_cov34-Phaeocystis_antarctica.AAC.2
MHISGMDQVRIGVRARVGVRVRLRLRLRLRLRVMHARAWTRCAPCMHHLAPCTRTVHTHRARARATHAPRGGYPYP